MSSELDNLVTPGIAPAQPASQLPPPPPVAPPANQAPVMPVRQELEEQPQAEESKAAPQAQKVFTRSDIRRSFEAKVHLPDLYPGYKPWVFPFKLKLSKDANERRQEYLDLSASEMAVKLQAQVLDEVCDLLVGMPSGFGDLKETGKGPGHSFRSYVETSDEETRDLLYIIVEGANNLYWKSLSPREFRGKV